MGGSLQDQLLKQGIVTKKQAKAAKHELTVTEAERRKAKEAAAPSLDAQAQEAARKAIEEKAARDRELNQQREIERAEAARLAEARDIIRQHKVRPEGREVTYHFTDQGTVKHLPVSKAQQSALGKGMLAIVEDGGKYYLLPEDAAEKLLDRAPEFIVCFNERNSGRDSDDPYAEHPVPDDLVW